MTTDEDRPDKGYKFQRTRELPDQGITRKAIAIRLGLSTRTIHNYAKKLGYPAGKTGQPAG